MSRPEVINLQESRYVADRLGRWQGNGAEMAAWENLSELGRKAGWTDEETALVTKSLIVAIDGLGDKPLRFDGTTKVQHALETALIIVSEMKGDATAVSYALLHDTVEDSLGDVTLDDIEAIFGNKHRQVIDGLSQVAAGKEVDRAIATIHKLYNLVTVDPRGLAVKIADRIHFWRHISHFPPEKLVKKAEDTLLYVPAATALGFYNHARELFGQCWRILTDGEAAEKELFPDSVGEEMLGFIGKTMGTLPTEFFDGYDVRPPTAYDAYLATGGNLKAVVRAKMPVFLTIVVPDGEKINNHPDLSGWKSRSLSILSEFFHNGIISEPEYLGMVRQVNGGQLTVKTDLATPQGHLRLRLVTRQRDRDRKTSIFDIESSDPDVRQTALRQAESMRLVFAMLNENPHLVETVYDFREFLEAGMMVVYDADGKAVPMIRDGTVLDAILTISHLGLSYRAESALVSRPENTQSVAVGLGETLHHGDRLKVVSARERTMSVAWFDYIRAPHTRRYLQRRVESQINHEIRQKTVGEATLAVGAQVRGVRVIEQLIQTIANERGLVMPRRWIGFDDPEIFPVVRGTPCQEFFRKHHKSGSETERAVADFLIAVGTDAIRPDSARTSVLWQLAETIVNRQAEYVSFAFILPDQPGQAGEILTALGRQGVNVVEMNTMDTLDAPGCSIRRVVWVTVSPAGAETVRRMAAADEKLTVAKERRYCE